jgi:hypothetical protein
LIGLVGSWLDLAIIATWFAWFEGALFTRFARRAVVPRVTGLAFVPRITGLAFVPRITGLARFTRLERAAFTRVTAVARRLKRAPVVRSWCGIFRRGCALRVR